MLATFIQRFKRGRRIQQWESTIESFLSAYAGELSLTKNPEKAFRNTIEWTPPPLREEWKKILARMEKGSSLEEGWGRFIQEAQSPLLTRVGSVLIHLCREGVSPSSMDALQRITEDVRMQERNAIRAFAQKLTVLTLLFIAVSALIPAFFLSFISIGSTFMESTFTPEEVLLITILGFPLLDAVLLTWVWAQSPIPIPIDGKNSPRKGMGYLVSRWDFMAKKNGVKGGWNEIMRSSTIEGASLFLVGWCGYLMTQPSGIEPFLLIAAGTIFPLAVNLAWQERVFKDTTRMMERQSLDALLYWSALPATWSFERKLQELAAQTHAPLREEWDSIMRQVKNGSSVPESLQSLGRGRESVILSRVRQVLIQGYVSGTPLHEECARLATEGMARDSLRQEKESSLLIEKYTLLGAGGIVVPLILGLSTGMVENFAQELGNGALNPSLQLAAGWGTRGYLFIYSIFASIFVGLIEGEGANAKVYITWLLPLSQFIYWGASLYTSG
jgi:Flp pilus assembly protein TadB